MNCPHCSAPLIYSGGVRCGMCHNLVLEPALTDADSVRCAAHGWASLPWVAEPTRAGWWGVRWPSGRVVGVHLVVHAEIFGPMISDSKVVSWKDCGYHDGVWWAGPYDSLEALREAMTPNGEVSHDSADQKL